MTSSINKLLVCLKGLGFFWYGNYLPEDTFIRFYKGNIKGFIFDGNKEGMDYDIVVNKSDRLWNDDKDNVCLKLPTNNEELKTTLLEIKKLDRKYNIK